MTTTTDTARICRTHLARPATALASATVLDEDDGLDAWDMVRAAAIDGQCDFSPARVLLVWTEDGQRRDVEVSL
jgi:hypothetical protein